MVMLFSAVSFIVSIMAFLFLCYTHVRLLGGIKSRLGVVEAETDTALDSLLTVIGIVVYTTVILGTGLNLNYISLSWVLQPLSFTFDTFSSIMKMNIVTISFTLLLFLLSLVLGQKKSDRSLS